MTPDPSEWEKGVETAESLHGARVVDVTQPPDERGRMVVLDIDLDTLADEFNIPALGATVAEANPRFPANDPVVVVAFADSLSAAVGNAWEWWDIGDGFTDTVRDVAKEWGTTAALRTYSYPAGRLTFEDEAPDKAIIPSGASDEYFCTRFSQMLRDLARIERRNTNDDENDMRR